MSERTAAITREQLMALAAKDEEGLRADREGGALPPEWEQDLAAHPGDTLQSALYRVCVLKRFYHALYARSEQAGAPADPAEAQAAAAALLRREPVRVRLDSGRVVRVTSRSTAAMIEMAAHQARLRLLEAELTEVGRVYARLLTLAERDEQERHRKRLRRVEDVHRRLYSAQLQHRERLYAHLATPSGAAARPEDPAPEWWREVTPLDDARLLSALLEAGPVRYGRLGPAPEPKRPRKEGDGEGWGYEGLLTAWGIRRKVPPAEMMDADLAQALTEVRLAAPPSLEEEAEG